MALSTRKFGTTCPICKRFCFLSYIEIEETASVGELRAKLLRQGWLGEQVLSKRGRLAVFLVAIALIAISLALLAGVNGGEADDDEGQPGPVVSVPTASAPSVPP